ncbi:MAG TPA: glycosyltransferase family 4 protein [Devosia sp.]|nr:glycosyltransferase family 4 protein [Devosia sp.]
MIDRRRKRSSIMMLGSRGINGPQGGVETHIEALAPLLVDRGWDISVLARKPYMPRGKHTWNGVEIEPVWAPQHRSLEALVHTAMGVALASARRPDVVHIHAIGPALMTPGARAAGLRTVVTHHGYDYDRDKWGGLAKTMLKVGERLGMTWSNKAIAVSDNIAQDMSSRYGRPVVFLPNGVTMPAGKPDATVLETHGLEPRGYVLNVSRIVPEKRQLDLIAAYGKLVDPAFKLVLVGGADHPDPYEIAVRQAAAATPGVVMTGFQRGTVLAGLFGHAGLFVLPSSHEGMPIALLEALSYGLPVLASDIPANLALGMAENRYFALGDLQALADSIASAMANQPSDDERQVQVEMVRQRFGWNHVADSMSRLYAELLRADGLKGGVGALRAPQSRSITK